MGSLSSRFLEVGGFIASKDETLTASDLAMLQAAMKIVERVTYKEAEKKPDTARRLHGEARSEAGKFD